MRALFFQILGPVLLLTQFCACSSATKNRDDRDSSEPPAPYVDEKFRLAEDRKKLEELRSEIPEKKKIENDEMALLQRLLGELKYTPMQARDKFDNLAKKKRDAFNKDMTKTREKFNTDERKSREAFNKDVERERSQFQRMKRSVEQRKEFYDSLDERRKNFNADTKSKRDDFESDVREKRKDFEDYMRERTSEFNQEHRAYIHRWNDYQKQKSNPAASNSGR